MRNFFCSRTFHSFRKCVGSQQRMSCLHSIEQNKKPATHYALNYSYIINHITVLIPCPSKDLISICIMKGTQHNNKHVNFLFENWVWTEPPPACIIRWALFTSSKMELQFYHISFSFYKERKKKKWKVSHCWWTLIEIKWNCVFVCPSVRPSTCIQ